MGYQVYEDQWAAELGVHRWAGYGVPTICDSPDCDVAIDGGMSYRCENHVQYDENEDTGEEIKTEVEGCFLRFCDRHQDHQVHGDNVTPKPDVQQWVEHVLADDSWQPWRDEYPDQVAAYQSRPVTAGARRAVAE